MTRTVTQSTTQIETAAVTINAKNPEKLSKFYQDIIGLTLFKKDQGVYSLGVGENHVLVEIYPANSADTPRTGLYHMAFLLPTRKDLADNLYHLLKSGQELEGASDHGYSEALYLHDLEGNGIEIYADKDQTEWEISTEGYISGIVEPMDGDGVLALADQSDYYAGMPAGTIMGHIHLSVADLDPVINFYYHVMGLGVKYAMGQQAVFLASGGYHHHLGANTWQNRGSQDRDSHGMGLRSLVWQASASDMAIIKENLDQRQIFYQEKDNGLSFHDPSGNLVEVKLA
ncbi:hypothetical protein AWM75_06660 [Aerococcus urinaehominis]|uniref:Uncharacterized protein n=1 Tax=Aerococcus urinaehominis TaxID=128944 RepID=A0A0X8FN28_9LACT|nr:VOC family protein [Aerococcus urinaehominis]AMB99682.1 hypothetical protein AWM75_06660 [Aerococcus urinaehominis]SDL90224.1 catechol 2,3-dioxygenase [Aerococcus urinaehominis]